MARDDATPQQLAYRFIRGKILSGDYPAGSWLKTDLIAQQLAVSRMPVRDALRQLDSEGLVTIRLNRGATVTNLTPDDIFEIFEMRAVLEGLAASHAARRATEADLHELEFRIDQMERVKPDRDQWIERHDEVHDFVCALSGRAELTEMIQNLRLRVRPYLLIYSTAHLDPELAGFEHRRFLQPLRDHDPAEAERVLRGHVMANADIIASELAVAMEKHDPAPDGRRLSIVGR